MEIKPEQPTQPTQPTNPTQPTSEPIIKINKGTGAGGSNTNYHGKKFEEKTSNVTRLLERGFHKTHFTKTSFYLSKSWDNGSLIFVSQNGLKKYMKSAYEIDLFRFPDEAYIINHGTGKKIIKILEKKEQNVEGSVETKLWSGPSLKREYELLLGEDFEVHYAFCVSDFLKKKMSSQEKKYITLHQILLESRIHVLFGDDEDYFDKLDEWVGSPEPAYAPPVPLTADPPGK